MEEDCFGPAALPLSYDRLSAEGGIRTHDTLGDVVLFPIRPSILGGSRTRIFPVTVYPLRKRDRYEDPK